MTDIIFKEYELEIKRVTNMIESDMSTFELNAESLYMLESTGFVSSDTEANDMFLESVGKLMIKFQKFFNSIINKMKELFIKLSNKFSVWEKEKEINLIVKVWKKALSNPKLAKTVKEEGSISAFSLSEYIKNYEDFLKSASLKCNEFKSKDYDNIDQFNIEAEKAKKEIREKINNIKPPYSQMDVIEWVNNDDLGNWRDNAKKMLTETEKVVSDLRTYTQSEDDLNRIKVYQGITSMISLSFSTAMNGMFRGVLDGFDRCNSLLKEANKKNMAEVKRMKEESKKSVK